jgi:FkbM family methyltransferase
VLDLYVLRRAILRPYAAVVRRFVSVEDPVAQRILEIHSYRPALWLLWRRTKREPDLLTNAPQVEVALDVGTYDGHWAREIHDRYGATVFSFEPDPEAFERSRDHLVGCARVHLMPFGLAARDGDVEFLQAGPGSTAFLEGFARSDPEAAGNAGRIRVPMRDVKGVFDELRIENADFVNMNIEGGEFDVLDRLIDTGYIERCGILQIQFHEWMPGAYERRRRIHKSLRRTHRLEWDYPFMWERWTRIPQASPR